MARSFVLGAKLLDCVFQNVVLKALIDSVECYNYVPSNAAVRIIYKGTSSGLPARKLLVDFWAVESDITWKDDCADVVNMAGAEFANDLICALFTLWAKPYTEATQKHKPWMKEPEQYQIKDI